MRGRHLNPFTGAQQDHIERTLPEVQNPQRRSRTNSLVRCLSAQRLYADGTNCETERRVCPSPQLVHQMRQSGRTPGIHELGNVLADFTDVITRE